MLKSRIGLWIFVIILCVGGTYLIDNVPKWMHTVDINICSDVVDENIAENIMDNRYGEYKAKSKSEDFDVIFSMDSTSKPGYELRKDFLYTPLVMYVEAYVDDYEGGFIQMEGETNRKKIDLYTVLRAMENGEDWSDIGIHEKVVKGKVVLYIPDEKNWCYPAVEELFYITLNNGITPNVAERVALHDRVNAILDKCEMVSNISQAVYDEYTDQSKSGKVFIGPECLYLTSNGMSNSNNINKFVPVYFTKTTFIYANVYLKTNYSGTNIAMDFIKTIQTKKNFMSDTGWRVKDSTFDIHGASNRLLKVPT